MLNSQTERIDYRELLTPPSLYKTSFAVGTTYSLDLETLTAVCAIVGLNEEMDSELTKNPLYMLEAIRRASGKLLVFCQGGQIKTPDKPNRLLPLLENCVCEIHLENKRSFHPKIWFLKFTSGGLPDKYRLIIMSRNLTFDRSWDIAIRLDSITKDESVILKCENAGESMRSFLQWLFRKASSHNRHFIDKKAQLNNLADEIVGVEWRQLGKEFESFDFIPYGIDVPSSSNLFDSFHKILIMTPFLSKSIIEIFEKNRLVNPDCTLITRKSELSKLNAKILQSFSTYTLKDDIVDGEERISELGDAKTQDIHAKVYLRTKWSNSELYIGSANASHNAFFGGNVECMLALKGKQRYLNVEKLKQDLFGSDDKSNPFERVEAKEYTASSEDEVLVKLESVVREFCDLKKQAIVTGNEQYNIAVNIQSFQCNAKMTLSPLVKKNQQPVAERMLFTDLKLKELSEWYIVTASNRGKEVSRVLKIQTKGIPSNRDVAVFSDIVGDKNTFLNYISFLLSEDYLAAFLESKRKSQVDYNFLNNFYDLPVLYERMLKAASSDKESLREIRKIISLMNDNIIPNDFLKLYEQFEKVVKY